MRSRTLLPVRSERAKVRGATAIRRAVLRARAAEEGREWARSCPDDPQARDYAIAALIDLRAEDQGPISTAGFLGAHIGRICPPVVDGAPAQTEAERLFTKEAADV